MLYRHDYEVFLAIRKDQLKPYDAQRSVGFYAVLNLLAFVDLNQSTLNSLAYELLKSYL